MGWFTGFLKVKITSADVAGTLLAITEKNIPISAAVTEGELSVTLDIGRRDYPALKKLCDRRGERLEIVKRRGLYWTGVTLGKRPVLLVGLACLLALVLFLPTRVLFFEVEGNVSIPERQILDAAQRSGIRFGASRREVRSERMKNALLGELPQLQWAGVNTYGCVAVISVRERSLEGEKEEIGGVSSIIAACDGLILSTTVTQGNALCAPGQTVRAGQVLISGYTDVGLAIRACRAEGEVFARTRREIRAVTPVTALKRAGDDQKLHRYSILLGKKRINLWKGSGIWEGSCGRMYEEYYITLPGGFALPIALVKETIIQADIEEVALEPEAAEALLRAQESAYLSHMMISGKLEVMEAEFTQTDDCFYLAGNCRCTEMIGRVRQEKIGE